MSPYSLFLQGVKRTVLRPNKQWESLLDKVFVER